MQASGIMPQSDVLPIFVPTELNPVSEFVVFIEQAQVSQKKFVCGLRASNRIQRDNAGCYDLRILDISLCFTFLCAHCLLLKFVSRDQSVAQQASATRKRQYRSRHRKNVTDFSRYFVHRHFRADLHSGDQVLVNQRIENEPTLCSVSTKKNIIYILQQKRGIAKSNVATDSVVSNPGVSLPRDPSSDFDFRCRQQPS